MIALLLTLIASPTTLENVRVESGDTVIANANVSIDQGRVIALAPSTGTPSGKVLTAGLIETVSQIGAAEVLLESSTTDFRAKGEPLAPAFRIADSINPLSVRIPITRSGGVTSVIVSPHSCILAGTGAWLDLTGKLSSRPDPSKPVAMFGRVTSDAADCAGGTRGTVWLKLRQALDDARLHRKTAGRPLERIDSLSSLHLDALYPVLDGKLPLVLGAHRASDILEAIDFAKAERIKLVIQGGAESWLVASQLKDAKVPVIVQPYEQLPYDFDMLNARDDVATLLEKAGVQVILSAGINGDQNARRLRQEAGLAVALGMSRAGALKAVTSTPAEVFDRGASHGTVAAGRRADLVLWSGDPFELSTIAEHIWIEGAEQPLSNRQQQLAERYKDAHD